MRKILFILCMVCGCWVNSSNAEYTKRQNSSAAAWWDYALDFSKSGGVSSQFVLGGAIGKEWGWNGTNSDEGGIVAVIATKVVEHGGYFCARQIQCANCKKCSNTWTKYFVPNGGNKCMWLCENGWSGYNCATQTSYTTPLDTKPTNRGAGGAFAGVSIRNSGGDTGLLTDVQELDYEEYDGGNKMVVLGVLEFFEHGVLAQPVYLRCERWNWKKNDSALIEAALTGKSKVLCASGYKPKADGSDCEMFDPEMRELQNLTFCNNFPAEKYNPDDHEIEADGNCTKYFCKDKGKAFAGRGDVTCVDCESSILGGASRVDGTCKKCSVGQYYNKETDTCELAGAYSKTDLQYGKGKTNNDSKAVTDQCWTFSTPTEYKLCVTGSATGAPSGDGSVDASRAVRRPIRR